MKAIHAVLFAVLLCVVSFSVMIACGDDDDDDDDSGGWSCSEGCSIIYDDCNAVLYFDGQELSESDCVQGCEEEGMSSCQTVCMDNYEVDVDCEDFIDCLVDCEF